MQQERSQETPKPKTIEQRLKEAEAIDERNGVKSLSTNSEHYRVFWEWIHETDPKAHAPGDRYE